MNLSELLKQRFEPSDEFEEIDHPTLINMASRGSCRNYQPKDVSEELIKTLCAVSLCAPTKSDLQQRDIIILQDPVQKQAITDFFPNDLWMAEAPSMLIFCGNNRRQRQIAEWRSKPFENDHLDAFFNASVDAGIVLGAFVTAAESVGLGCCPVSQIRNYSAQISDLLDLPSYVFPVAGLCLGWPAEPAPISMRLPLSITVHQDQFSEEQIQEKIQDYDERRSSSQPYASQRQKKQFGTTEHYGWSEDKARQYSVSQREGFGDFIRSKGFVLK